MLKYIGKYKVEYERDLKTSKALDNSYIKCKNKGQIYRYNTDVLALYTTLHRGKYIIKQFNNLISSFEESDFESIIYFKEEYIEQFAEIGKAIIKGKDKAPKKYMRKTHPKGSNFKFRLVSYGITLQEDLNLLEANIAIKKYREEGRFDVTREKYSIEG